MDNKFAIILGFMVLSLTASVASVEGQDQDVLDNGLVRIMFNHRTGQFEALPLTSGGLRLYDAGPSFQKDSRKISARDATRVEARRENFEDPVGRESDWLSITRTAVGIQVCDTN